MKCEMNETPGAEVGDADHARDWRAATGPLDGTSSTGLRLRVVSSAAAAPCGLRPVPVCRVHVQSLK
jgi:hypothetical protein